MDTELNQMGSKSIPRLLFSLAIPIIIGMFANALYNIVDRFFIGQFISKEALTAATVYHPFFMLTLALGSMLGIGGTAALSVAFGEKNTPYGERILNNVLGLTITLLLPLILIGEIFAEPILKISGASEIIMPLALSYFRITTIGMFFGNLAFILACLIRTENNPKFALKITIIGALLNIVLDALFIIVFKMGIFGAGFATALSQIFSAIYAISFYTSKKSVLRIANIPFIPEKNISKKVISIGISSSVVMFSFGLFSLLMNKTLYQYGGDDAIATMGVLMSWDSLLFLPIVGICDAAQPIFGYNYGAKLFNRIFETIKWATVGTLFYGAISFTIVFFASRYLVSVFTDDVGIITEGAKAMKISYSAVFFAGFGILMASLFQALGRAKICIFMGLCRTVIVFIPLLIILPKFFGLNGAWLCLPAIDFFSMVFGLSFFYFERKHLLKEEAILKSSIGV